MALIKCGISFPTFSAIVPLITFFGNTTGTAVRSEVLDTCNAGNGISQIKVTPGFLASSLPYVGHHDCTDGAVCRNIPFVCPLTSCCLSQSGALNGTSMHCGCLDRKGECVPLRSFRVGWQTCDGDSGRHSSSHFEMSHVSTVGGEQCSDFPTRVDFDILQDGSVHMTITTSECIEGSTRNGRMLGTLGTIIFTLLLIDRLPGAGRNQFSRLCRNVVETMKDKEIAKLLDDVQLQFIKAGVMGPQDATTVPKPHANSEIGECRNSSDAVFSMCPAFLSGLNNGIATRGKDGCKASGQCSGRPNISSNTCAKGKHCCVFTRAASGFDAGCECVDGIRSCLEYKEFEVSLKKCTDHGNVISSGYTVVALNFGQPCEEMSSLMDMYLDGNGKIRITMKVQKCIPSSSGGTMLRVEHVASAEQSVETFLPTLKAYIKNMRGDDLIRFLGE